MAAQFAAQVLGVLAELGGKPRSRQSAAVKLVTGSQSGPVLKLGRTPVGALIKGVRVEERDVGTVAEVTGLG